LKRGVGKQGVGGAWVDLHTILPSPIAIVYGVWLTRGAGGLVGGRILRNGRAIVLQ